MIDLKQLRHKRMLKVPCNLSQSILAHPAARSIAIYLELKPLFISGVIHADNGNIPYYAMADYTGYSFSGFRKHFDNLKKLNLAYVDQQRNVHLASYASLKYIFTDEKRIRTHKLINNNDVFHLLKTVALYENLEQQKFAFYRKLSRKLALNHLAELSMGPYSKKSRNEGQPGEIGFYNCWNDFILTGETNQYIDQISERFEGRVNKHKENLTVNERQTYKSNYISKDPRDDRNSINPFFSVSCQKMAEILNRKSASTGSYQQKILEGMKMISVHREVIKTSNDSAHLAANFKIRPNVVNSKNYDKVKSLTRVKNRKFLYRSLVVFPNQITINVFGSERKAIDLLKQCTTERKIEKEMNDSNL